MITEKLEKIVKDVQTGPATACVIFLHGLGASGDDFAGSISELGLPNTHSIRFLFPHAPLRAVTLNRGYPMPAWYDILGLSAQSREDEQGVELAFHQISDLIEEQHQMGIPYNRIFVLGFSQGGALALYTGLHFPHLLGGVAALSSYLPLQLKARDKVLAGSAHKSLPIFMAHGQSDPVVAFSLGQKSKDLLNELGFKVEWHTYPIVHTVSSKELLDLGQFILNNLS